MIFATVGTHGDGFPRLLHALAGLGSVELVVQHGHGPPPPNAVLAKPFMAFPEMLENFERADVVVMHCGVGSLLLAVRQGHVPIVMPRLRRYGEHVDDHQAALAHRLAAQGRVLVAWEEIHVPLAVQTAPARLARQRRADIGLDHAVRRALLEPRPRLHHGVMVPRAPRRLRG